GTVDRLQSFRAQPLVRFLQHAIDDLDAAEHAGHLLACRQVDLGEGAITILLGSPVDDGESSRLTEDAEKARGIPADSPELPPLFHDQRPADDGEDCEDAEDNLCDGAGAEHQLRNAAVQARVSRHSRAPLCAANPAMKCFRSMIPDAPWEVNKFDGK